MSLKIGADSTVVCTWALLFPPLGSVWSPPMVASLVRIVPLGRGLATVATMVMVVPAPSARLPRSQVTSPLAWLQLPSLAEAEAKETSEGRMSVTVTPVASEGPLLEAVRM